MREFSKGEIRKMGALKKRKFTNREIAKVLHIAEPRIDSFLEDEINDKKTVGDRKRAGEKRDLDPGRHESQNNKNRTRDSHIDSVQKDTGDRNNSGFENGEGIIFTGGKKSMVEKKGSEVTEEDEYQCYNCDHIQGTPFTDCPKCGSSNSFD